MSRIRILYVIGPMMAGGAERHLIELISNLDRDRFEAHAAVLSSPGRLFSELQQVCTSCICLRRRGKFDFTVLPRLGMLMKRVKPHIIHSYMWTGNLWGRLAALLFYRSAIRLAAERCPDRWKSPLLLTIDRLLYRFTHRLVAVAAAVADFYHHQADVPEDKTVVIRNGKPLPPTPVPTVTARSLFGLPSTAIVYTLSGRFSFEKGHLRLLQIFPDLLKQVSTAHLLLPGEGPLRENIRQEARRLGIAHRVLLPGFIQDQEALYAATDILVVPSDYEGISNVLLEGMARGRAVVATNVGGNPEVIEDGVSGMLVPMDHPGKFLTVLVALGRNPFLRKRLASGAQRRYREHFTLDQMIRSHQELYLDLIQEYGIRS